VADRHTDRRTSCDGIVRAMHTRRAVKTVSFANLKSLYNLVLCPKILSSHLHFFNDLFKRRRRRPRRRELQAQRIVSTPVLDIQNTITIKAIKL